MDGVGWLGRLMLKASGEGRPRKHGECNDALDLDLRNLNGLGLVDEWNSK
jgi:hypothetical protein